MSKSYSKYKTVGVCNGSNTRWYRARVRRLRGKNRQIIRNMVANKNAVDYDDCYLDYRQARRDSWLEPTDGTYTVTAKSAKRYKGIYVTCGKIKK